MSTNVLYLDKMSSQMEEILLDLCPSNIDMRFLCPASPRGIQGTIAEANYVLATNFIVSKEVLDTAEALKMIQRTGVGYDNVDIEYAKSKNIPVSITLGTNASSVAELVIAHILALYRKITVLNSRAKEGKWDTWTYRHESFEIFGKTVGVIGAGAIGRELIKRLTPFAPECIIYYDLFRLKPELEAELGITYCSLDELLSQADIISIHVPWLESTRGLIGKDQIAMMKKNVILINTSRGPIVDQKALVEAIKLGKIAGAGLDVYDPEPYSLGDEVLKYENIITTPHAGAATVDNYKRVFKFCFENIARVENGEAPKNIVNGL